jgi:hypothetical protein
MGFADGLIGSSGVPGLALREGGLDAESNVCCICSAYDDRYN